MNEQKAFDEAGALDRVGGDRELLNELVDIFFSESDEILKMIGDGIAQKNAKMLEAGAHSIKSALGNCGAMKGHDIAYRLESKGKKDDFEGVEELYSQFKASIEEFKRTFEEFKKR